MPPLTPSSHMLRGRAGKLLSPAWNASYWSMRRSGILAASGSVAVLSDWASRVPDARVQQANSRVASLIVWRLDGRGVWERGMGLVIRGLRM